MSQLLCTITLCLIIVSMRRGIPANPSGTVYAVHLSVYTLLLRMKRDVWWDCRALQPPQAVLLYCMCIFLHLLVFFASPGHWVWGMTEWAVAGCQQVTWHCMNCTRICVGTYQLWRECCFDVFLTKQVTTHHREGVRRSSGGSVHTLSDHTPK